MDKLLFIREYIKAFVSKYDSYVRPFSKFALMFITLTVINSKLGYAARIDNLAITLVVSLLVSFLPLNFIPVVSALFVLLHMYGLSMECAAVVGIMLFVMFLLYFRFSPKDTILLTLTPLCFVFKIPYAMPLVAGLVAAPTAMASVGCGVITYFMLAFIVRNEEVIRAMADEEILVKFKFLFEELLFNREMLVLAGAFAVTIMVVYIVRRMPVDHCWTMAIIAGTLTDIVVVLFGDLKYGTYVSIGGLLFGSLVGVVVVTILKFFAFNLDYSRTEKVQFEDDLYYYYVKAVPKNTISEEEMKRIVGDDDDDDDEPVRGREASESRTKKSVASMSKATGTKSKSDLAKNSLKNNSSKNNSSKSNSSKNNTTKSGARKSGSPKSRGYERQDEEITDIERAALAKARASRRNNK